VAIEREKLVGMYRLMVRIRTFEERVLKEVSAGVIPGAAHLYAGQEAVAVGACAALRSDDFITSTHRGHGHLIAVFSVTERPIQGDSTRRSIWPRSGAFPWYT
jgi:TPP-dependent pyruvate/acetoin dehydrogenase alpha subunit